jgi:hypothetical protein
MTLPRRMAPLALLALAAAGCGAPAREPARTGAAGATACPSSGLPAKLLLHDGGVPDQFVVALAPGTEDVPGRAAFLTLKHGGRLLEVHPAVEPAFALQLRPDRASDLAREPDVCLVEQHEPGRGR